MSKRTNKRKKKTKERIVNQKRSLDEKNSSSSSSSGSSYSSSSSYGSGSGSYSSSDTSSSSESNSSSCTSSSMTSSSSSSNVSKYLPKKTTNIVIPPLLVSFLQINPETQPNYLQNCTSNGYKLNPIPFKKGNNDFSSHLDPLQNNFILCSEEEILNAKICETLSNVRYNKELILIRKANEEVILQKKTLNETQKKYDLTIVHKCTLENLPKFLDELVLFRSQTLQSLKHFKYEKTNIVLHHFGLPNSSLFNFIRSVEEWENKSHPSPKIFLSFTFTVLNEILNQLVVTTREQNKFEDQNKNPNQKSKPKILKKKKVKKKDEEHEAKKEISKRKKTENKIPQLILLSISDLKYVEQIDSTIKEIRQTRKNEKFLIIIKIDKSIKELLKNNNNNNSNSNNNNNDLINTENTNSNNSNSHRNSNDIINNFCNNLKQLGVQEIFWDWRYTFFYIQNYIIQSKFEESYGNEYKKFILLKKTKEIKPSLVFWLVQAPLPNYYSWINNLCKIRKIQQCKFYEKKIFLKKIQKYSHLISLIIIQSHYFSQDNLLKNIKNINNSLKIMIFLPHDNLINENIPKEIDTIVYNSEQIQRFIFYFSKQKSHEMKNGNQNDVNEKRDGKKKKKKKNEIEIDFKENENENGNEKQNGGIGNLMPSFSIEIEKEISFRLIKKIQEINHMNLSYNFTIKKIWKIIGDYKNDSFLIKLLKAYPDLNNKYTGKRIGNTRELFLPIRSACNIDSRNSTDVCNNKECEICSLIKALPLSGNGLTFFSMPNNAFKYDLQRQKKRNKKITFLMLLCSVICGKPFLQKTEKTKYGVKTFSKKSSKIYQKLVVYNVEAILPKFLYVYQAKTNDNN
ncbi:c2h2-like zinc finger protein [Anaeramoeba flamelloides]|uniref:C2h2-like zinc finger protein n=1 Tax=Anaeramoeba flamelloides TaxID=1746091 RepID=A0ABQ8ZCG0_9EUKA|nr:c2h2-like zinc finger protein [Anaeramoeba flamelloides]